MPRYVAFLRGVSPTNAKMADLRACFEKIGFTNVRTVLSSGNVIFTEEGRWESNLTKVIESGMTEYLLRVFPVIVRSTDHLLTVLKADPFAHCQISPEAKRVVTFLGQPNREEISLPIESEGVRILSMRGSEVFVSYVPNERGPIFMTPIEKTFGKNVTTRTWDTVKKCSAG
jgi:uncharacterized protein (DUF1697 family)